MHFPCFCILEVEHMTLLQKDRENIELGHIEDTITGCRCRL